MRVKGGPIRAQKRKRTLKKAKGYFGAKSKLYKKAHEQVIRSEAYAFADRKKLKSDYRKLWITRISAACKQHGISYSKFISGLNKANVELNRKMISEMAINSPETFAELVKIAKENVVTPKNDNTTL
ncbi:50S ribosomal protein L20 [Mycoplasma sp. (ex Biomphalaria glabrata)]|uniref:50S ribosomal protein L20 n=1 Tax=Mycoplasma sp. (ex Biomphalaria glabrata) TaxID=1749074 RepID=UPI00073AC0EA|nr:50S ribosomal protein L20 [Mycoplasma sp. (ex Biomphalaria glabrata)]ALV23479.1 50S ribosomal protein L20 [Mycoplasma sp. (ex Biomphalaria glabrata)]